MKIIKNIDEMQLLCKNIKSKRRTIGFVPTMGYLHEGHISLVDQARQKCDFLVVSIFINPTQFGPKEDLKKYPRDIKRDLNLLSHVKVDAVFYPKASDIYPEGYRTFITVEDLSDKLCGKTRPGHFRGVATVVLKLFNIIKPDLAFFGEKDFQQQIIIKKMVNDLDMDVKIMSLPTVREPDGLAMSSRNTYLSTGQRMQASVLYRALQLAKVMVISGEKDPCKIKAAMKKIISERSDMKIDYISFCDPDDLSEVNRIKGKTLVALAAYAGKTRLIDNILVNSGGKA